MNETTECNHIGVLFDFGFIAGAKHEY
jgi:hypothetical protein